MASQVAKTANQASSKVDKKANPDLLKKPKRETPSINLNSFTQEEEAKEEVQEDTKDIQLREPFNEEKLKTVWDQYYELRKSQNASEMELIVLSKPRKLLDDFQVELYLSSPLETSILERAELEFVKYMRINLKNGGFKIKSVIKEVAAKDKLYTDRDKYEFMVKQNPNLKKLKDELGLDFEF